MRPSPRSAGHGYLKILAGATVAGFGLSFGRDIYRNIKKNAGTIILLAALLGTAFAVWDMTRGHKRTATTTLLIWVFDPFVILVSLVVTVIASAAATQGPAAIPVALIVQAILAGVGWLVGRRQRSARLEAWAVEDHNLRFLDSRGFRDVGGRDQTLVDPNGQEIRFDDMREDAILFKVQGRRGVRARIELDRTGRMIDYSYP